MIASDARMPLLSRALDPAKVEAVLRRLAGWEGAAVRAIRAARYKPGRRCLIEYDVALPSSELVTLVGKARARGADHATFDLLRELRRRGFDEHAVDGICVPEPIAVVPELGLWLQCKVRGVSAMEGLAGANGLAVARRLAEAAHKLHVADVPARREHTVADELRILHERLDALAAQWPDLGKGRGGHRLGRLLAACDRLAATIPAPPPEPCGIHRDFYPDQVLVAGERLYLLDFDLYSHGDPALDIG
ncbi:MAG TPA: phosphotransferase, partial [Gemmatimonadales bacterium]